MKSPNRGQLIHELANLPRETLTARIAARLDAQPRCPVARYLAGCLCFDGGKPATGVRHLMIAHHADAALESAALLVFAGLNWVSRPGEPLLAVLLDTWNEFRRPQFDRRGRERDLLDAFAEADPGLPAGWALARRLWRLPIVTLRAQLRRATAAHDVATYPMLAAAM